MPASGLPNSPFISADRAEGEVQLAASVVGSTAHLSQTQLLGLLERLHLNQNLLQGNSVLAEEQCKELLEQIGDLKARVTLLDCLRAGSPEHFRYPRVRSMVIKELARFTHEPDVLEVITLELTANQSGQSAPPEVLYEVLAALPPEHLKKIRKLLEKAAPMWDSETFYSKERSPCSYYIGKLLRGSNPTQVEERILKRARAVYRESREVEVPNTEDLAAIDDLAAHPGAKARKLLLSIAKGEQPQTFGFGVMVTWATLHATTLLAESVSDSRYAEIFAERVADFYHRPDSVALASWISALVVFPNIKALAILKRGTKSKDEAIAKSCWRVLAQINLQDATTYLEASLSSPNWETRVAAREALMFRQYKAPHSGSS
ncbi:MAG: hypothetical protein K1X83_14625 [Oligoflexia bacterium]|nr:hypothetical protein [Oligoflexia bacterium]